MNVSDVFAVVQAVYAGEGFKPHAGTTREQRNGMWDAALACVHYGHPRYNPRGGDPRWMNKRASWTHPPTDDVVVFAPTREYFDFIIDSGADSWRFNLGGHAELLPAGQVLFAPSVRSLPPVGVPIVPPTPTLPPPPSPAPAVCSAALDVAVLKSQMATVIDLLQIVVNAQAALGSDMREVLRVQAQVIVAEHLDDIKQRIDSVRAAVGAA